MNNKNIHIAIFEPSQIVYEGLSNILLKTSHAFKLFSVDCLEDINTLYKEERIDFVIINPSEIQNKTKEFFSLKKKMSGICWVALVYNYFDRQLLEMYDDVIRITDAADSIAEMLLKLKDSNSAQPSSGEQEQLTDREIEVLKLMVAGLANKEIAEQLFISIHTVISHRKNISQKTGIKSQAGLTIYAISNKIIKIEDFTS